MPTIKHLIDSGALPSRHHKIKALALDDNVNIVDLKLNRDELVETLRAFDEVYSKCFVHACMMHVAHLIRIDHLRNYKRSYGLWATWKHAAEIVSINTINLAEHFGQVDEELWQKEFLEKLLATA